QEAGAAGRPAHRACRQGRPAAPVRSRSLHRNCRLPVGGAAGGSVTACYCPECLPAQVVNQHLDARLRDALSDQWERKYGPGGPDYPRTITKAAVIDQAVRFSFPIIKMDRTSDGDIIVYGKCTDGTLDADHQIVDADWSGRALEEWLRSGGNVRVQHSPFL